MLLVNVRKLRDVMRSLIFFFNQKSSLQLCYHCFHISHNKGIKMRFLKMFVILNMSSEIISKNGIQYYSIEERYEID